MTSALVTAELVAAWSCGPCFRCGHSWVSVCLCGPVVKRRGIHKAGCSPPGRCSKCKSAAWTYPLNEAGPGKRKKPKEKE